MIVDNPQHGDLMHVPKFVRNFYALVMDPHTDHLISWDHPGRRVVIHDKERVGDEAIQAYFGHSNYESLLRQMNNYGFTRIGSKKQLPITFEHPFFRRGDIQNLHLVFKGAERVEEPPQEEDQQMAEDDADDHHIVADFDQEPPAENWNEPRVQQRQRLMISIDLEPEEPAITNPEFMQPQRRGFFGARSLSSMIGASGFAKQRDLIGTTEDDVLN